MHCVSIVILLAGACQALALQIPLNNNFQANSIFVEKEVSTGIKGFSESSKLNSGYQNYNPEEINPISTSTTSSTLLGGEVRGNGHLSTWSRLTKKAFLHDLSKNDAKDWVVVMGNEGGDLDSMVSAISFAYYLSHLSKPIKAIALLQTEEDALDLRPENILALDYARMAPEHRDLLTLDELPIKPKELGNGRIKGIALVDHNSPRSFWANSKILSIVDHHVDQGLAKHAHPRVINLSKSCCSLVAKIILDHDEKKGSHFNHHFGDLEIGGGEGGEVEVNFHGPVPRELVDLILRTIALDSDGLKKEKSGSVDRKVATRLLTRSTWKGQDLKTVMNQLDDEMGAAKKNTTNLNLRDLLRRDFKGDSIATLSSIYPTISLGFASTSVSMNHQIQRTPEETTPEWFAIERAFCAEMAMDVSVVLNSFHNEQGKKVREIAIVVAHGLGKRLPEEAADSLFAAMTLALTSAPFLELEVWNRPDGKPLLPRRAIYRHFNRKAGRKLIRPLLEDAIKSWKPQTDPPEREL